MEGEKKIRAGLKKCFSHFSRHYQNMHICTAIILSSVTGTHHHVDTYNISHRISLLSFSVCIEGVIVLMLDVARRPFSIANMFGFL